MEIEQKRRNIDKNPLTWKHSVPVIMSILVLASLSRSLYRAWRKQDIVHERQKRLDVMTEERAQLEAEYEYSQTEEYVEQQARDKLGMAKEGETVVIFELTEGEEASGSAEAPKSEQDKTPLQEWMGLFW